jgi:trans-aconitate 2-methyltransferase
MTEWDAASYAQISGLQRAMAAEVLGLLDLDGSESVLDVGCGNGKVTAEIAARLPQGTVVGIDASCNMIDSASSQFGPPGYPNLNFLVADVRCLPFKPQFDLIVSFNPLHWIHRQEEALRSLRSVVTPEGKAQIRLVPLGERKSLETVLEETRCSSGWSRYFRDFQDPYLRLTPDQYAELARKSGFRVVRIHTAAKAWDFQSREAFFAFGTVTFVAWTRFLPDSRKSAFINDVLDRYQLVAADKPGEESTFKFYQMDVTLAPAKRA